MTGKMGGRGGQLRKQRIKSFPIIILDFAGFCPRRRGRSGGVLALPRRRVLASPSPEGIPLPGRHSSPPPVIPAQAGIQVWPPQFCPRPARLWDSYQRRSICVGSQAVFRRTRARIWAGGAQGVPRRAMALAELPASASPPSALLCPACRAPAGPGKTPAIPRDAAPRTAPPGTIPAALCPDRPECCAGPAAARCPATRAPSPPALPPICRQSDPAPAARLPGWPP